jgi:hypothetical protein
MCIDNAGGRALLTEGKWYDVIPYDGAKTSEYIRIVDDTGEDCLYRRDLFARS